MSSLRRTARTCSINSTERVRTEYVRRIYTEKVRSLPASLFGSFFFVCRMICFTFRKVSRAKGSGAVCSIPGMYCYV